MARSLLALVLVVAAVAASAASSSAALPGWTKHDLATWTCGKTKRSACICIRNRFTDTLSKQTFLEFEKTKAGKRKVANLGTGLALLCGAITIGTPKTH